MTMPALEKIMRLPAPEPGSLSGPLPASQVAAGDQNGDSTPIAPKKVEIVPTQTEVVGMIRPPADIRSIVDKTAQFVAKNGPEFEKRILANEKNNVKFNFLNATDYYHAYYQHRVNEFKKQLAAPQEGTARAVEAPAAAPVTAPVEEAPVPRKELVPPELEQYSVRVPEGISGLDLDVIKLTAQFVARNGKSFLSGLTQREHNNPQFYFLKPTHSLFGFFTTLADAYSKVLMPPKGLADRLKRDASNRQAVLERCIQRLEWEKVQLKSRRKEEEAAERERTQMALIDWHDFVVVTTIDFNEGEDEDLPEPLTLEEVVRKAKRLAEEVREFLLVMILLWSKEPISAKGVQPISGFGVRLLAA